MKLLLSFTLTIRLTLLQIRSSSEILMFVAQFRQCSRLLDFWISLVPSILSRSLHNFDEIMCRLPMSLHGNRVRELTFVHQEKMTNTRSLWSQCPGHCTWIPCLDRRGKSVKVLLRQDTTEQCTYVVSRENSSSESLKDLTLWIFGHSTTLKHFSTLIYNWYAAFHGWYYCLKRAWLNF